MDTRKYKLINITIVIATIILLIAYGKTQINLNNAKNHRNLVVSNLVEENKKEEFKLGEFLNRLRSYNDISLNNIVVYDSWGEVTIKCKGDFTTFKNLLSDLGKMDEIKEINSLVVEEDICTFILVFKKI
ncbi:MULTISPECIES: hypothetical protein [Clostridium]|uniref:Uncharacterized protein n=1 Tax=Clostridium sulfidigenes TaxID=318464 RepID=A0A084JIU3_9CLOT|nr:hypothetical protein [Clostridium sulfidigenes]KEZ88877.1 hypothetical protein IO99_01580 [Clostridium sulfidigenes]